MTTAKCNRCGGSADGGTFEQASLLINHAVGLSRGIPCGDNYNSVVEIVEEIIVNDTVDDNTVDNTVADHIKTDEGSYKKVEGKSGGEHITFDEVKQSAKKKLKFK